MYKSFEMNSIQHIFSILLLTSNVPIQIGKMHPRDACTPVWEPLCYNVL